MFSTLKKLGHKRKLNKKGKDKKNLEMLSSNDKLKAISRSSFDLCGDPMPPFNPARRHSCFSAFIDTPTERLRRDSNASQSSSCSGASKCRRGSTASTGSTASAENYRVKRLVEIAQLDRYVEHLKKSADPDNLSHIPNRLCVALLLKSVLQRRERDYVYEYLHSNRRSSESDIAMKCRRDSSNLKSDLGLAFSDVNNNNNTNNNHQYHDNNNNNNSRTGKSDLEESPQYGRKTTCQEVELTSEDSSQDLPSKSIDAGEEEQEASDDSRDETPEERVPGALLKAYQMEFSKSSAESDSEVESSKHHRYRKRSESKTRRKSIALFPQNYEIY